MKASAGTQSLRNEDLPIIENHIHVRYVSTTRIFQNIDEKPSNASLFDRF